MKENLYGVILIIHILGGFSAFFSAFIAIFSKILNISHQWHIYSGRIFYYGMLIVFLTSLILTSIKPNLFLALVAIFSFYMTYSGWRMALNRKGIPTKSDYIKAWLMLMVSIVMLLTAGAFIFQSINSGQGIVIAVFGAIGLGLSLGDLRRLKLGSVTGKDRISAHLGMMMGATIAAITAFLVTNFQLNPPWLLWILPAAIISPIISLMNRKLYKGKYF